MKEQVRKLNHQYGFNLTEDEIDEISQQAAEMERFVQPLNEIDLTDVMPILKVEKPVKR
jgi:Asp-tRNA(Asn)/Glu-tRNA(Gln) amidotransferase C subunit